MLPIGQTWIVRNPSRGNVVASRVVRTVNFWDRLLGLLLSSSLASGEGLWLIPCRWIHTFGMRFSIDAIFLDRSLVVVGVMEQVRPFRPGQLFWRAHSVLEVPAGTIDSLSLRVGDRLEVERRA